MNDRVVLLDVNTLVALLWHEHVMHMAARAWFFATTRRWATCPITQLGCIRVMANPAVVPAGISVRNAASLLAAFSAVEEHEFWPDDLSTIAQTFHDSLRLIQGHNQLTDRYLLALAAARGGVLATFDRTVGAGLPANSPLLAHLEIIPV